MNNNINIAELLKDCPKGMELYSPLCGKCVFDRLNMGTIICKKQNTQEITFTSEGYYMLPVFNGCECMIFPSKDQRDWSKFQRPIKAGDVVISTCGNIHLLCSENSSYCAYRHNLENKFDDTITTSITVARFATKKEKERLFQAIRDNGYKWNPETKNLEKLIKPKFKVGDRIKKDKDYISGIVTNISEDGSYKVEYQEGGVSYVSIAYQDDWELVPDKFDINTLKQFESRVLVRNSDKGIWIPDFFACLCSNDDCPYMVVGGIRWKCCIPYEGNEHLLDKTDDCDDYYKTWKDETDE